MTTIAEIGQHSEGGIGLRKTGNREGVGDIVATAANVLAAVSFKGKDVMNRYIVGTGDHVYQVLHPIGELPQGMTFGNTSHVATDSKDRVYVYQRQDPPVLVFDINGSLLATWGDGQLLDVHGIYISPDDEIFLVDRDAHEVVKFSTEGRVLLRIGTRKSHPCAVPLTIPQT